MDRTLTTRLARLDAAPETPVTDTAARRRDAMLERIVALPQSAPAPARPGRLRRRIAITAAAALLVVPAAVAGTHLVARQLDPTRHGLDSADLASWVAGSTPRSASELSAAAKQWCVDATDSQAGPHAAVSIAGGDERGSVASMLITRAGRTDVCLADRAGGGGYWELVSGPGSPLPAIGAREVLLQSAGEHGSDGIGTAWGQAGADVRRVVLHLGDRDVEAVVTDGVWHAWWPAAVVPDGFPERAAVTSVDGRIAEVRVQTP